jgi:uncharacterized membrane protein (TIGR02234 family)
MNPRSGLRTAVLLCLLGSFVILVCVGRVWTTAEVPAGPLADAGTLTSTGAELLPGVRALGLVGLAGVVALAATRRVGRALVGLVLLATGVGVVLTVLVEDLTTAARRLDGLTDDVPVTLSSGWSWATAAGGLLLAVAGLLTLVRGTTWAALGQRYEAPTSTATAASPPEPTERSLWEALDRGEDPTASLEDHPAPPADREADRT